MISAQSLTYIMHILYNINYCSLQWSHERLFYIQIFEKVHFKSKISLIIGLIRFNLSFFDEVFDLSFDISVVNSRFRKSLTWVRSLMLKSEMVKGSFDLVEEKREIRRDDVQFSFSFKPSRHATTRNLEWSYATLCY